MIIHKITRKQTLNSEQITQVRLLIKSGSIKHLINERLKLK